MQAPGCRSGLARVASLATYPLHIGGMMTNPPASIDDEAFTVEREIRIDAPRATVWSALTTPEHIAGWFGQQVLFPDGVHAGARGTFAWPEHGPFPVQIVTFSPTEEFAFTWGTPGEPKIGRASCRERQKSVACAVAV